MVGVIEVVTLQCMGNLEETRVLSYSGMGGIEEKNGKS